MPGKKRVAILLDEADDYPATINHFIWSLCDVWREWGIDIVLLKGISQYVEADLLIPHIDTTCLPKKYMDFFQKYPRVVNRHLQDISKRLVSRDLVTRKDRYQGPVIVKTNENYGGCPDFLFLGPKITLSAVPQPAKPQKNIWSAFFHRRAENRRWAKINSITSSDYPIFPSLKEVPKAVFANASLVVERFLPEYEKGVYYLRIYKFFGEQAYCARLGSPQPIVKQQNIISREEIPIPDEVVALRHKFGMDYGKLDFVIHDGRMVLLDINRTPGLINSPEQMKANALKLAPGINRFLSSNYGDKPGLDNTGQNHKSEKSGQPA